MKKFTLERMPNEPDNGPWYCIWLNTKRGRSGATIAENIGDEIIGRYIVDLLNALQPDWDHLVCADGLFPIEIEYKNEEGSLVRSICNTPDDTPVRVPFLVIRTRTQEDQP